MTVAELRAVLDELPDDRKVMLSSDDDGNAYGELAVCSTDCLWDPTWYTLLTPVDCAEKAPPESAYPVLVLYPG